jgi:Kef-type K+ transport system membrane component KefB
MTAEYALLITLGGLLIFSPMVKSMLLRLNIPAMVGYIVLGFLISLLNHHWQFISKSFDNTFSVLAQLGVVALLFRVGLKSHTEALLEKLPEASPIWLGNVLISLALGFVISRYALALPLETSLVIATALSATSVAVSVAIWEDMHKLGSSKGRLLVDVAELDDLSSVLLLAILIAILPVIQSGNGEILPLIGTTTLTVLMKLILFVSGCYLFAYYLEARFTRFSREVEHSTTALTITILGAGLAIAAVAGYLGFSLAIGALFAGLAFSRDPEAVRTQGKFAEFYEFFTPFFFIHIGMQIDPAHVPAALGPGIVLLVAAILGKVIGTAVPALRIMSRQDALLLGISMIPRAEIALVVMYQGHRLDDSIISAQVFSAMVLVSLGTSIIAPLLLRSLMTQDTQT